MRTLFVAAAILTGLLGVAWVLFPQFMLAGWGTPHPDAITVYMARRYGALFFGYTAILWMARRGASSPALTAILAGSALVTVVIGLVSLVGLVSGVIGPSAWVAFAAEVILAAGFIRSLARARSSR